MSFILSMVFSFVFWIVLALQTAALVVFGLFFLLFKVNIFMTLANIWARINLLFLAVRYDIEGLEKINKDQNYVFMGNHQSYVDIFLMIAVIDKDFLFMAKEELFKIPFFGAGMKALGIIPINRGESRDALKSLFAAAKKIQEGFSVLLFPEGTRSDDGEMLPFKRGAFTLAVRTGLQIAPFVLEGTGEALPKSSFRVKPFHKVKVKFLDPVSPEGLKDRELLDMIRERMENEQRELRSSGAGE